MRLKLTDLVIRKLTPTDKQITYWDTAFPGFGVRVLRTAVIGADLPICRPGRS